MPTDLAVADLLEQEESKALEEQERQHGYRGQHERGRRNNDGDLRLSGHTDLDDAPFPRRMVYDGGEKHTNGRLSANVSVSSQRRSRSTSTRRSGDRHNNPGRHRSRSPRRDDGRNGNHNRHRDRGDGRFHNGHNQSGRYRDDGNRYSDYRSRDVRDERDNYRHSHDQHDQDDRRGHRHGEYRSNDNRNRNALGRHGSPPANGSMRKPALPEITDDERDRRTVFVQQLGVRVRSAALREFFESAGQVRDAQIVKDRVSKRPKGVGYVEFVHEESVQKAMDLTGRKLCGIPVIVQASEAIKNHQSRTAEKTSTHANGKPFHRLYVGNIHFNVTEDDLRELFGQFGELEFVQLQKEDGGRSKGFGFVQYTDAAVAKRALEQMNSFELAGRPIRVGLGNDKYNNDSQQLNMTTQTDPGKYPAYSTPQPAQQGSSFSGLGGRGQHAGGTGTFDRAGGRDTDKTGASALDDNDVNGASFSNISRASLMAKLARTEEPTKQTISQKQQSTAAAAASSAAAEKVLESRCICIKYAWTQADTTEPDWQKEMETDVETECENKYGIVKHVAIDPSSQDGEIYVKFDRTEGGRNAYRGLNGRIFNKGRITAQYVVDAVYNSMFPKAAKL